jgi:hypothetical protein
MATRNKAAWPYHGGLFLIALTVSALSFSVPAYATLIAEDTANAMPGWYATLPVQFTEELTGGNVFVDASVDYAVYAPGDFNLSFPGKDPSGGLQYVYRYQLHNASGSGDFLKKMTIGLVDITSAEGWFCTWVDPEPIYTGGGIVPPTIGFVGSPPTSVNWAYKSSSGFITAGEKSKMLIFTSPFPPTYGSATINSRNTVNWYMDDQGHQFNWWKGQLPSPVPEPATFVSLFVAGVLFFGYRVLRRKKR